MAPALALVLAGLAEEAEEVAVAGEPVRAEEVMEVVGVVALAVAAAVTATTREAVGTRGNTLETLGHRWSMRAHRSSTSVGCSARKTRKGAVVVVAAMAPLEALLEASLALAAPAVAGALSCALPARLCSPDRASLGTLHWRGRAPSIR